MDRNDPNENPYAPPTHDPSPASRKLRPEEREYLRHILAWKDRKPTASLILYSSVRAAAKSVVGTLLIAGVLAACTAALARLDAAQLFCVFLGYVLCLSGMLFLNELSSGREFVTRWPLQTLVTDFDKIERLLATDEFPDEEAPPANLT